MGTTGRSIAAAKIATSGIIGRKSRGEISGQNPATVTVNTPMTTARSQRLRSASRVRQAT
jgi:hypothetical protein